MANTISDELNRLIQAKAGIKSALEEKGLTIGDSSTLDEFPGLIQEMEVGGGESGDVSTIIDLIEGDVSGNFVIPEGTTKIQDSLFKNNNKLVSITIPSTVNNIGEYAFSNCYNLVEIEFVNFTKSSISTINYNTFTGLNNLERLILPQNISLIANDAFNGCYKLNNLVIPSKVSTIQSRAFSGIGSQAVNPNVTLLSLTPPSLAAFNFANTSCIIYVPGQSVDSYKNAAFYWNNVSTRIQPLAAMDYDSSTMTVTASGRDNVELYIDSSLIDSSVYTFTPGTEDSSHVVTVKSVDPSLGVLDEVSQEILIEGEEIDYSTQYFGISALADSSIGINTLKTDGELLYSEDQENWTQWDYANETLDLLTGETLYFKGNNGGHPCVWDKPLFNITGSVDLHGNISSILWGDDYLTNNTIGDGGMAYAFKNSTAIINCKNLIMAPTYNACYEGCFYGCVNLITAPQLPQTSVSSRAYNNMFAYCSSLVNAPDLPALNLPTNGYNYMFLGCSSLNYIKAMFTTAPTTLATSGWVQNVSSTGTFVMNADATWDPEEYRGTSGIPEGWTVEKVTA